MNFEMNVFEENPEYDEFLYEFWLIDVDHLEKSFNTLTLMLTERAFKELEKIKELIKSNFMGLTLSSIYYHVFDKLNVPFDAAKLNDNIYIHHNDLVWALVLSRMTEDELFIASSQEQNDNENDFVKVVYKRKVICFHEPHYYLLYDKFIEELNNFYRFLIFIAMAETNGKLI